MNHTTHNMKHATHIAQHESRQTYHSKLRLIMDDFVHQTYTLTKKFPKEELFGSISQLRRAALSVPLNYIEGFARGRSKVNLNFLEISYGSLQECKYLLEFAVKEGFVKQVEFEKVTKLADQIGAMLYGMLKNLRGDK